MSLKHPLKFVWARRPGLFMSGLNLEQHNVGGKNGAPKVSVIIPAYKTAEYIGETLQSVFDQTFKDYEVIVVNDGAPDTEEIERAIEPYVGRVIYIKQENRGLSGARNTAIRNARGEYIALLDSDDVWEPEYLEVQVTAMERDPTIDVLYPNASLFGDPRNDGRTFMDLCPSEGEVTFESLITQRCTVFVSVIARREMIVRAGMFDESLRSSEDFDMWLRVIQHGGRIAYHRRPVARSRRRAGSLSSDPVWMCQHILRVLDKAGQRFDLTPAERGTLTKERARFHAALRLEEGKREFFNGNAGAAADNLREANALFKSRKISVALLLLRIAPGLLLRVYDARDRFILRAKTRA